MHGSKIKIPSKNVVKQRCAEEFNFGVKPKIMLEVFIFLYLGIVRSTLPPLANLAPPLTV
jgi:hypothetical protein